ncbi:MAG: hypothetical protein QXO69_01410 [archaeon]
MVAKWNRFKSIFTRKPLEMRESQTPVRKRFASIEEQKEHLKSLESESGGAWGVKKIRENVKEQYKALKNSKKRGEDFIPDGLSFNPLKEGKVNANLLQFEQKFNRKELEKVMKEFGIEKKEGPLVIGAGFTGKFARSFIPWLPWQKGYKIIFTDINPEYVDMAKRGRTITKQG